MNKDSVGGFFVELGLVPDRNSFDTGNKLVDGLTDKYNRLIGVTRNAAVMSAGIASAEYKTSQAIGISTEKLETWKAAAKIAGVNTEGLIGSMGKLSSVMNHLTIDGRGLETYASVLAELGLDFNKLEGLDPSDAFQKIIETAQEQYDNNPLRITTIVGDILGGEGQNFFIELQREQKTIADFLNGASKTVLSDEDSIKKAQDFGVEYRELQQELASIKKLFGEEVAGEITPYLKVINDWFGDNKDEIVSFIKTTAEKIGTISEKLMQIVTFLFKDDEVASKEAHTELLNAMQTAGVAPVQWIRNNSNGLNPRIAAESLAIGATPEEIASYKKAIEINEKINKAIGKNKTLDEKEVTKDVAALIQEYENMGGYARDSITMTVGAINKLLGYGVTLKTKANEDYNPDWWMNDGIMRPDGTVTQVAPDDWVFAAKNVGDLARAFIPQNYQPQNQGPSVYTINQTFNVSGSKDIPQVIKQQAFNGTREGLLQAMSQSSQRMQMMSGTR